MGQRGPLGSLPALQQQGGGEAWLLQPRSALCESLSQPWRAWSCSTAGETEGQSSQATCPQSKNKK